MAPALHIGVDMSAWCTDEKPLALLRAAGYATVLPSEGHAHVYMAAKARGYVSHPRLCFACVVS